MSYETFAFLNKLIEKEMIRLENDFDTACHFIPAEPDKKRGQASGIDRAHKIYMEESAKLDHAKEELRAAVQAQYRDHPNPEMRKFWGIQT
jgi:hypothetical protein